MRKTIDDDIIVARIHERGSGLEDLTVKAIIGHYKKEVLEALKRGEDGNPVADRSARRRSRPSPRAEPS